MAYQFKRQATARFRFTTDRGYTEKTSLTGINATLPSAVTICDGVSSLMAIVGQTNPLYIGAERTVTDSVDNNG